MNKLLIQERSTGEVVEEEIYGGAALKFLYTRGSLLRNLVSRLPLVSILFGWWQKQSWTQKNINPFIKRFKLDSTEFEKEDFESFNDFFIRKLKPSARPIATSAAIIPADGRYRFFPVTKEPLFIKGGAFDLEELLQDSTLAKQFHGGSCVVARLCPIDCHRFVFPIDCTPGKARLIPGPLFSVNPIAINQSWRYLTENKRYVTELESESFGKVLCLEVGATNVGSVHQTYEPGKPVYKGDEKGYFAFGGSAMTLLFQPNTCHFSKDILNSSKELELLCKIGQSLAN